MNDQTWALGHVDGPNDDGMFKAAIDIGRHGAAIECHGSTVQEALERRALAMDNGCETFTIFNNRPTGFGDPNLAKDDTKVACSSCGLTAGQSRTLSTVHKLNGDQTVAVSTEVFLDPDMTACPRGVKVQLEGAGGVLIYGTYDGKDPFFVGWAPVPRRRPK